MSKFDTIYGIHTITAVLARAPQTIKVIYIQAGRNDQRMQSIIDQAGQFAITVHQCPRAKLEQLINIEGVQHQGVVAQCTVLPHYMEEDIPTICAQYERDPFLLVLDGVTDPHNLGACLRTADAAGVMAVIAPKDNSASLTAAVRKVACGAAETVPFIQVTNLARTLGKMKDQGIWLFGADDKATVSIHQTDLKGAIALVLGAEGRGLRQLTKKHCDLLVSIPMYGTVSSLNVSVATGVCLFEAVRQRGLGSIHSIDNI